MSSLEFSGWMAFYNVDPWGEERADLRAALIACTIANVNRGEGQEPFEIEQFLLNVGERALAREDEDSGIDVTPDLMPEQAATVTAMLKDALFGGRR
jgi:hypothetical protein